MSAADAEDDGEWSCEFEDYYNNDNKVRGDGQVVKVKIYFMLRIRNEKGLIFVLIF